MCIRDRDFSAVLNKVSAANVDLFMVDAHVPDFITMHRQYLSCLLYTSPSPRDGLLSMRRQASDVYKRQGLLRRPEQGLGGERRPVHGRRARSGLHHDAQAVPQLSLIHISEPTRRTPLYASASVRCV